jgi:hypothetical protein
MEVEELSVPMLDRWWDVEGTFRGWGSFGLIGGRDTFG